MGARVKVLQKGKVTIPAEMREALGMDEGDYVTMELQAGHVVISPLGTIDKPTDTISGLVSGVSLKEPIDKEIAKASATRARRKLERGSSR